MHTTNQLFMVEPVNFRSNEETSASNAFQKADGPKLDQALVKEEFQNLVRTLRDHGVQVHVEKDIPERDTPDSIFPNNWVSFHDDGSVYIYPMLAENRRRERSIEFVLNLAQAHKKEIRFLKDLSFEEDKGRFLEGTGSIVFDHVHKYAYCALGERSDLTLLERLCEELAYTPIAFESVDRNGFPNYHTNVVMSVGESYAVVCLDSIKKLEEREKVHSSLINAGKDVIAISLEQLESFCGNIIQVHNQDGEKLIAMSETAFEAFSREQRTLLEKHGQLLVNKIPQIEAWGGGSVRCMICENRLP